MIGVGQYDPVKEISQASDRTVTMGHLTPDRRMVITDIVSAPGITYRRTPDGTFYRSRSAQEQLYGLLS